MIILIIFIGRGIVIALDNLHNEWNKSIDVYISAVVVLAPLLEEVYQLLPESAFAVFCDEYFQELWRYFGSHLRYGFGIHLRESLECFDWKVHAVFA